MDGVIVVTGTIFKAAIMMAWKTIEIEECLLSLASSLLRISFFFLLTKSWNTATTTTHQSIMTKANFYIASYCHFYSMWQPLIIQYTIQCNVEKKWVLDV